MADDWDLVGGDPAPGDAQQIRILARDIGVTGELAHEARVQLDGISVDLETCSWEGASAKKFAVSFDGLAPELGQMATSYDGVAYALRVYATRLDEIQHAANQALTRARLAKQRRDVAQGRLDAARRRIGDLNRQLIAVKTDEKIKAVQAKTAMAVDPLGAADEQDALHRIQARRHAVEVSLGTARTEEGAASNELTGADGDLDAERRVVGGLKSDRLFEERMAADRIRSALDGSLKNKSNFSKANDWAKRQIQEVKDFGNALAHGDTDYIVAKLKEAIEVLEVVVMVVTALAVVACFVAGFFTGGATWFFIPFILKVGADVGLALSVAKLVLTTYQAAAGLVDPDTGRPAADWGDVGMDAVWVGLGFAFRGETTTKGYFKRFKFPDGRLATGAWRNVEIADSGRAVANTPRARIPYLVKGTLHEVNHLHEEYEKGDKLSKLIGWMRRSYQNGDAVPHVNACYAN